MKPVVAIICIALLSIGLLSCGGGGSGESATSTTTTSAAQGIASTAAVSVVTAK